MVVKHSVFSVLIEESIFLLRQHDGKSLIPCEGDRSLKTESSFLDNEPLKYEPGRRVRQDLLTERAINTSFGKAGQQPVGDEYRGQILPTRGSQK